MPQVTAAVRLAMRTCRFFPKPVELRELMTGRADERADLAWGELLREVRRVGYLGTPMFTDASMLPTIHTVFGGWRHLCETLPAGGPELVGWIKQFKVGVRHGRSATATRAAARGGELRSGERAGGDRGVEGHPAWPWHSGGEAVTRRTPATGGGPARPVDPSR